MQVKGPMMNTKNMGKEI